MQIPKNIQIKANGKTTAHISPKADGLKDSYIDTRLNGESTLEFLLPATSEKIAELTPECEIWADGRVYILRKDEAIDTVRDDKNALWTKIMAVEKWYELDTSYVEPSISNDATARPPADLAVIIVGGGSNLTGGRYATGTAGHALYAILQDSGWTLGTVDVTGIRDLEAEKVSRLELIKMIQDIWGGYLVFDSINKIIHLRDAGKWQTYNGFQVRYRKNLKHITRTQSNKIVTKLYPFGHDDLDIAIVNGGKKYITNNSYTLSVLTGVYKNQDIYDQQELLEKARAELELICRPRYLYKVKLVDVRVLPEYEHEDFSLGDMADIIDPDIAPDSPRPRIIRHKYNLFQPWQCELDIGDPEERLIEQLKASFGTTQFIDGKFNGNGKLSGHSLEYDSISADKIKVNELVVGDNIRMGPNAYISWGNVTNQPNIGQVALDKIKATYIDSNGVWTPNIYATNISTLYGKIKTAQIENLVVGGNVTMGSNAVISWGQVSSKPFIPDDYYITTITEDTIRTTNIYARYLEVGAANIRGVLSADQITTNISQVNRYLDIGNNFDRDTYIRFGGGPTISGYFTTSGNAGAYLDISASVVDFMGATVKGMNLEGYFQSWGSGWGYIDITRSGIVVRDRYGDVMGSIMYS
ncbi:phage tail protein [uncultured Tissierella sp.]|uniref:phage tail protein n=1 Tax=uncultured Tissierella sp. TaxID=448160 RepID=UPI0028041A6D|nr:phage tail protein [uncultured Tissierella sp.]MDU5081225.1 phage tail protein [Bacillota bacterium]